MRFAAELGYEVTVVKDATASFTDEQMHAGLQQLHSSIEACGDVFERLQSSPCSNTTIRVFGSTVFGMRSPHVRR